MLCFCAQLSVLHDLFLSFVPKLGKKIEVLRICSAGLPIS